MLATATAIIIVVDGTVWDTRDKEKEKIGPLPLQSLWSMINDFMDYDQERSQQQSLASTVPNQIHEILPSLPKGVNKARSSQL